MIGFLKYIKLIEILILMSFIYSVFCLNKKSKLNLCLFLIILTSVFTEFFSIFLVLRDQNFNIIYSLSFIIHQGLWLYLICSGINFKSNKYFVLNLFLLFAFLNLLFFEKTNLNYLTFVIGSLIYILLFAIESYNQLKNENLDYFKTNKYLLIFIPILFFFGFSFMFSFKNSSIKDVIILYNTDLYTCISYFVNIIYYCLINLYIYRESKLKNG